MVKVFSFICITVLIFQNCGNNASFTQESAKSAGLADLSINGDLGSGDDKEDLGVIDASCDSQAPIVQTVNVKFQKPTKTCEWGIDGNLSKKDAFFRARIENKQSLGLPVGAVICDAEFDFKPQPFQYDDYFALMFNNNIITSGYNFEDNLKAENFGLLRYSWSDISGIKMGFGSAKEQIFCPQIPGAKADCSFPGHDTSGVIKLALDKKYIRAVMSNGVPADHSFTLVTFGDNDNKDCEHADVEFDVNVSYVIAE